MAFGFTTLRIAMIANIGGINVPISQFACSYSINGIPSCTALLPVGYTAATLQVSPAHAALSGSQLQIPLSITITVSYAAGDTSAVIPAGTYNIFCGWATGIGYRRTYNGYSLAIEGTHWLSALSFSSTLSASSHPNNPAHMTFDAAMFLGAGGDLHWCAKTLGEDIDAKAVEEDLWGQGILPWFLKLASTDRINQAELDALGIKPENDGEDNECKTALNLFQGDKLPLDIGALDADRVAMAIADDIAGAVLTPSAHSNSMSSMANTTFWDKLVGDLGPKYIFSIIPFPTKALVVPFIAGLRSYWSPTGPWSILARDMSMQDTNAHLPRALRAVGLLVGYGDRAGGNLINQAATNSTIGGMYAPPDVKDGMVMLQNAPAFMSEFVAPAAMGKDAVAADAAQVRGNAFNHPGAGVAPVNVPDEPKVIKEDAKPFVDKLAHAMYVMEILKNRWGDIHGPLRFDICPGSTIRFEGTEGATQPPGTGEARYGSVQTVKFFIDAQHQKASTSFRVAHIRTEDENQADRTSVVRHPLYKQVWTGDYMLELGQSCPVF